MSTASAKPAPKGLIALRARGLTKRLNEEACIREGFTEKTFYLLKDALETLADEASPAAERTATTKDIRDELESTYRLLMDDADFIDEQHPALAISIKGGCDSIKKCIDALDAQERAGAKA